MRTQVAIIGAGPAGLVLAHQLHAAGIRTVVLEHRSREYVEGRVRAGVLEQGTVSTLRRLGVHERMEREGLVDEGLDIRFGGRVVHLDLPALTGGGRVMVYGQQEVVKDLIAAAIEAGIPMYFEATATAVEDLEGAPAKVSFTTDGATEVIECDWVAGCDGFHGISRRSIPPDVLGFDEVRYPFAWFGVLAHARPIADMTYSHSEWGFALCSRRSQEISRLYLQVPVDEDLDAWSDARFWDELHRRMYDEDGTEIEEGEIFQRDLAVVRAAVARPMRYRRLLLAGDAAHIVPPTGAKGLNLAVNDANRMASALIEAFRTDSTGAIDGYSERALERAWRTVAFSTSLTEMLHRFDDHTRFERGVQLATLEHIRTSRAAQASIAERYVGYFGDD